MALRIQPSGSVHPPKGLPPWRGLASMSLLPGIDESLPSKQASTESTHRLCLGKLGSNVRPQLILSATGIDIGPFETQILTFLVLIAGLAYGYPKCLDFVNTKLMCHITLEGSDVTSASAVKFIRHKFDKAKGRDLTVRSIRMSEDNDPIPTKDGFADLSKFRWMRQYMPGLGRYRGHWVRLSRSTTDTRFAEAVNYAPPGWTSGHYTECEERHDYAKHGL